MASSRTTRISVAAALVCATLPGSQALFPHGAGAIRSAPTSASPRSSGRLVERRSIPASSSSCGAASSGPLSYHWPVKPFDRQHPIRGYFGDPRTPTAASSFYSPASPGTFNFHSGVDIVATTGTPVYPVVSGVATVNTDNVIVNATDGRVFEYHHIWPRVRSGQYVSAYETVLGKTQPHFGHVHLTEIDNGKLHNPLDPGHLEPYRDETAPVVDKVDFSDSEGNKVNPLRLRGSVGISVDAHDMPALPIVDGWSGLPVTPALVAWELRGSSDKIAIPRRTARDFRQSEPANGDFWTFYGIGTHQNKYGEHFPERVKLIGRYVIDLTPSRLETRSIANGAYTLRITVADTCGNSGSLSEQITIAN
jgi:hypothetical protein